MSLLIIVKNKFIIKYLKIIIMKFNILNINLLKNINKIKNI